MKKFNYIIKYLCLRYNIEDLLYHFTKSFFFEEVFTSEIYLGEVNLVTNL